MVKEKWIPSTGSITKWSQHPLLVSQADLQGIRAEAEAGHTALDLVSQVMVECTAPQYWLQVSAVNNGPMLHLPIVCLFIHSSDKFRLQCTGKETNQQIRQNPCIKSYPPIWWIWEPNAIRIRTFTWVPNFPRSGFWLDSYGSAFIHGCTFQIFVDDI